MYKYGIDKIRLRLEEYLDVPRVLERARFALQLRERQIKLNGSDKHALVLYDSVTRFDSGFLIELPFFGAGRTKLLTIKPNDFENIFDMVFKIKFLFGSRILDSRILRIDYCVDYRLQFMEFILGLTVKFKRADSRYLSKSGVFTGINFGKAPEVVIAYNKALERRIYNGYDWTRIESQLTRKKKPTETLRELSKLYRHGSKLVSPFKAVKLQRITFASESAFINDPRRYKRLIQLKTLCEESGLNVARKRLSDNGNFSRDFIRSGFYSVSELAEHPDQILHRSLEEFFRGWDDSYINLSAAGIDSLRNSIRSDNSNVEDQSIDSCWPSAVSEGPSPIKGGEQQTGPTNRDREL